jgi:hypothetical protein
MVLVIGNDEVFHAKGNEVVKLGIFAVTGLPRRLKTVDVFPALRVDKAQLVWTDAHNGAVLAV